MIGIREGAADGWRGSRQRLQGRPLGEWPVKAQAGVAVLQAAGVPDLGREEDQGEAVVRQEAAVQLGAAAATNGAQAADKV